ncbi:MAG TPA: hypothetical protein VMV10_16910 [Pirellulales bacterium]|nr:hypothetical protein [Pirellulales bacterium]
MAKKTSQEGTSKSDLARQYLSRHPGASVAQITDGLKAEGVEISKALASKIKYGRSANGATKKRGGRRKGAGGSVAGGSVAGGSVAAGSTSKAEAIRQSIRRFGKRFRPRDVIADLAEKGVEVSSAQVSTIAKTMGMRPRRKGRGPAATGARPAATRSEELSLAALVATKRLSDQLGGIENVKSALDALSKIL